MVEDDGFEVGQGGEVGDFGLLVGHLGGNSIDGGFGGFDLGLGFEEGCTGEGGDRRWVSRWLRWGDAGGLQAAETEAEAGFLGLEALAGLGAIGDDVTGLEALAFGDFEIGHGGDGNGDGEATVATGGLAWLGNGAG